MKEGLLEPRTDWASRPLRDELKRAFAVIDRSFSSDLIAIEAAMKGNQVFLPVLENASKAEKLRTTLGVFERSKFFFSLPASIIESIESVRTFCFDV
jgi:exocyst complex component 2